MTDQRSASELADVLTRMEIKERNATIERCAQAINNRFQGDKTAEYFLRESLAAIRALKDKP